MYRRQQPFVPNDYYYTRQMDQQTYKHQQSHQADHHQHMYTDQQPMQQSMRQETPFEYFTKPQQPTGWPMYTEQEGANSYSPPYPDQSQYHYQNQYQTEYQNEYQNQYQYQNQNQAQNTPPSFLTQFQNESGQMSFDKVLSTVGQLANTFQQVTPVIQQVSAMVKTFR